MGCDDGDDDGIVGALPGGGFELSGGAGGASLGDRDPRRGVPGVGRFGAVSAFCMADGGGRCSRPVSGRDGGGLLPATAAARSRLGVLGVLGGGAGGITGTGSGSCSGSCGRRDPRPLLGVDGAASDEGGGCSGSAAVAAFILRKRSRCFFIDATCDPRPAPLSAPLDGSARGDGCALGVLGVTTRCRLGVFGTAVAAVVVAPLDSAMWAVAARGSA